MKTTKINILTIAAIIVLSISGCNKAAANGSETAYYVETTELGLFTESLSEADSPTEAESDLEKTSETEISQELKITTPSFLTALADEVILSPEAFTIWGKDGARSEPYVKNGFSPCELVMDSIVHPTLYTEDGLVIMHSKNEKSGTHSYTITYNGSSIDVKDIHGPFCDKVTIYLKDVDKDGAEDIMMNCYNGSGGISDAVVVRVQPLEIIPFSCDREAVNEFITDIAITEVEIQENQKAYVTYTATDVHGNTYKGHETVKAGKNGNAEDYELNCWTIPTPTFNGITIGDGMDITGDINCLTQLSYNVNTDMMSWYMADMWIKYTYDAETGCYVSTKAFLWAENENGNMDWIEITK